MEITAHDAVTHPDGSSRLDHSAFWYVWHLPLVSRFRAHQSDPRSQLYGLYGGRLRQRSGMRQAAFGLLALAFFATCVAGFFRS